MKRLRGNDVNTPTKRPRRILTPDEEALNINFEKVIKYYNEDLWTPTIDSYVTKMRTAFIRGHLTETDITLYKEVLDIFDVTYSIYFHKPQFYIQRNKYSAKYKDPATVWYHDEQYILNQKLGDEICDVLNLTALEKKRYNILFRCYWDLVEAPKIIHEVVVNYLESQDKLAIAIGNKPQPRPPRLPARPLPSPPPPQPQHGNRRHERVRYHQQNRHRRLLHQCDHGDDFSKKTTSLSIILLKNKIK